MNDFTYLLNCLEEAAQAKAPWKEGYADARNAVIDAFSHLRAQSASDRDKLSECRKELTACRAERDAALLNATRDRCEECGSKVSSYPTGCPGCGAPNCCQPCCDRSNAITRAEKAEARVKLLEGIIRDADGCFQAALAEGWIDAIANEDMQRIHDLWQRRISFIPSRFSEAFVTESKALESREGEG